MKITTTNRYLTLMVNNAAPQRNFLVFSGDKMVYDLTIAPSDEPGSHRMYVDMARFYGEELTFFLQNEAGEKIPYEPEMSA